MISLCIMGLLNREWFRMNILVPTLFKNGGANSGFFVGKQVGSGRTGVAGIKVADHLL